MSQDEDIGAMGENSPFGGEDMYKAQLEIANKEKAQLQERLREVENRNAVLVKALFELSCTPLGSTTTKSMPIDVVQSLKKMSASAELAAGLSGKGSAYRRAAPKERALSNLSSSYPKVAPHISPEYTPFCDKAELSGHSSAVYAIQFSPNGRLLVSTSFDKSVCFWAMDRFLDKSNYEPKVSIPDAHRAPVPRAMTLSSDFNVVALSTELVCLLRTTTSFSSERQRRWFTFSTEEFLPLYQELQLGKQTNCL